MNPVRSRDRVAKNINIHQYTIITMNKIKLQTCLDRDPSGLSPRDERLLLTG